MYAIFQLYKYAIFEPFHFILTFVVWQKIFFFMTDLLLWRFLKLFHRENFTEKWAEGCSTHLRIIITLLCITFVNFFMDVLKLRTLRLQLENMCDPLRCQIWHPILQIQLFLLLVMLLFFLSDWFTWTYVLLYLFMVRNSSINSLSM